MSKKWGCFFLNYYKTITAFFRIFTEKSGHYKFFLIMTALLIQFFHILYSLTGGIFLFDLPVPKSLFLILYSIYNSKSLINFPLM